MSKLNSFPYTNLSILICFSCSRWESHCIGYRW